MPHVCVRDCYHSETLFKVGDILPGNLKPNKHFMDTDAKTVPVVEDLKPITAGDDPRSTVQMIEDIEKLGASIDPKTSRKEAFALWVELTKAEGHAQATEAKTEPAKKERLKRMSDMTPDEIDALTPKRISELFGIPYHGKTKDSLMSEVIEMEKR